MEARMLRAMGEGRHRVLEVGKDKTIDKLYGFTMLRRLRRLVYTYPFDVDRSAPLLRICIALLSPLSLILGNLLRLETQRTLSIYNNAERIDIRRKKHVIR